MSKPNPDVFLKCADDLGIAYGDCIVFEDSPKGVEAAKNAGMKAVIITVKHHDGFCIWPSKYTEHSVKNSPWRKGEGDLPKELSAARMEYGLKLGVYISPWDRNNPLYGSPDYNQYFMNQLQEVLTGYGPIFEVWFDGANGEGPNGKKQEYDWKSYIEVVRRCQPEAVIFSDAGDVRWVGNEQGFANETNWSTLNKKDYYAGTPRYKELTETSPTATVPGAAPANSCRRRRTATARQASSSGSSGHFGEVRLDGLAFGGLFAWPKAIHMGGGQAQPIVDVRADNAQRDALLKIMSGEETEPGATIFNVFASTFAQVHAPIFRPIHLEADLEARTARVEVEGLLEARVEPIRNPVTGTPVRAQIVLPEGFEYDRADSASGKVQTLIGASIPLSWDGRHAHFARLDMTGAGVAHGRAA